MAASGETILVIDDDPYIQEALGDRLESLGYRVTRADDGKQALEFIDRRTLNLSSWISKCQG